MQHGSSAHHAKRQLRPVASEDYKVRESRFEQMPSGLLDPPPYSRFEQMPSRLLDPPPYADSYMKSYSFDEYRPETQHKVVVVDNRLAKYKVNEEDEDVNTEADDFIKHAHKKFQIRQRTVSIFD
ncbi:uncharacterized protein LOC131311718 [Rhododendron vialii]|uniref:uncharacterized protein LOC131311718 n=1 Tax=Rhododendron vialii TaxID=182163 RepID=UPI00265DD004|nr:uncharacterized protein LOC131311718 [Rhododendron vialii]